MALARAAPDAFGRYVAEDGPVEWLTVLALGSGAVLCLARASALRRRRRLLATHALLALGFLFAAGEEVSWGQRLFGFESPQWFRARNAQGETNLHNLTVGGHKVNRVVFSRALGAALAGYFLVLAPLHRRSGRVRRAVDALGVPIPRPHQAAAFVAAALAVYTLVPSPKRGELMELAGSALFVVIVAFPANPLRSAPGA